MFIGDKDVIKEIETFFGKERKSVQDDLYEFIHSSENERRRKIGLAERDYFEDSRTKEQIEKDNKKKLKALEIAKKETAKEFNKETKWVIEI